MRTRVLRRLEKPTCWTLPYKIFEYFLGAFGVSLFTECLSSTEHSFIILRILRQRLLRRLLCTFPVFALDVARGHVCIDLLHEVIRLQVEYENQIRSRSLGSDSVNYTSVRSFGSSALSLGPDFKTEATPPALRSGESRL